MKTKKILYSVFALAMAAFTFTACEDVPEPYQIPGEGEAGSVTVTEPAGEGSLESPFNVAGVLNYLQNSEDISGKVYIKGKVVSITLNYDESGTFGNARFYISDDGTSTNQFLCYNTYYLDNKKWTSLDDGPLLKVGDEVVVYGNVCIYNGTYETETGKSYIYSLNGKTSSTGGGGTGEDTYLYQDFSTSLGSFTSVSSSGTLSWYTDYSSAMITGYQDFDGNGSKENQAGVTFLVSPEVDLTGAVNAVITINHALNYERGDINNNNSIVISKDYVGDVNSATWELLAYDTNGLGSSFTFKDVRVDIPSEYMGSKVVVALRHTCTSAASSTWEVKSLKIGKPSDDEDDSGSEDDNDAPYTVAEAIAHNSGKAWVKGYIVGWIDGKTLSEGAKFNSAATVNTNLLIADNANETDYTKCLPVQLPSGDARTALNLKDNSGNYKKSVKLYGSLEKYFGTAGLKSVTDYELGE